MPKQNKVDQIFNFVLRFLGEYFQIIACVFSPSRVLGGFLLMVISTFIAY